MKQFCDTRLVFCQLSVRINRRLDTAFAMQIDVRKKTNHNLVPYENIMITSSLLVLFLMLNLMSSLYFIPATSLTLKFTIAFLL